MAFGGLNATARDYARLGELYRLNGVWHGRQVVPSDWVKSSINPDAPHLMPGVRANSDSDMGYGYQWWTYPEGRFGAQGIFGQSIFSADSRKKVQSRFVSCLSSGFITRSRSAISFASSAPCW